VSTLGSEDTNEVVVDELQPVAVSQQHTRRANPMDLSTILHSSADDTKMPTTILVEQVERRSDSPEILDPDTPMVAEPLDPARDSPSPLDTNNIYHPDDIAERHNQGK
jgi:hypothetical protein